MRLLTVRTIVWQELFRAAVVSETVNFPATSCDRSATPLKPGPLICQALNVILDLVKKVLKIQSFF
jgi:hypothetical protein